MFSPSLVVIVVVTFPEESVVVFTVASLLALLLQATKEVASTPDKIKAVNLFLVLYAIYNTPFFESVYI